MGNGPGDDGAPPACAPAPAPPVAARLGPVVASSRDPDSGPGKKDYAVGYRKPPKHHQWAKGVSGNPKGRVKGSRNVTTIWTNRLSDKVRSKVGGKLVTETALEAMIRGHVHDTLVRRDLKNIAHVLREVDRLRLFADPDDHADRPPAEILDLPDEEIVARFLARQRTSEVAS
jgi:hypothetical protein